MKAFLVGLLLLVGIGTSAVAQVVDTVSVDSTAVLRTTTRYQVSVLLDSTVVVDTAAWSFTIVINDTTTALPPPPTPTAPPVAGVAPFAITIVDLRADSAVLLIDWDGVPDATQYHVYAPGFGGAPLPFSDIVDFPLTEHTVVVSRQSVDWDMAVRVTAQNSFGSGPRTIVNITVPALGGTAPPPPPPPPPPPAPGANLFLDFDDPANLGVNCAGGVLGSASCPDFFTSGYRKHTYLPTGGINGSGAINMHWFTGMSIGFSPIWIQDLPLPASRHFVIRFAVRQTAIMQHDGSGIKIVRLRRNGGSGGFGTMTSVNGRLMWHWDDWTGNDPISPTYLGAMTPADGQWHIYELDWDYSDINQLTLRLSIDGVFVGMAQRASTRGDIMSGATGPLVISPFAEMYSTGTAAGINTGDFVVDDFSYTILP